MKTIVNVLKKVAIALVVLIALGVIFGGSSQDKVSSSSGSDKGKVEVQSTASTGEAQQEAVQPKEKYTITNEELDTSNPYSASITGVLTNNTDRDYSYVQVEYIIYDAEGNQVGNALDNINNLKAGGSWKFSAIVLTSPDEIAAYELADVTAF